MLGSPTKIHHKYDITEDDLDKIRAIAITRGMKISSYNHHNMRPSSTIGPHSSPRSASDGFELSRNSSAKTVIPTAETTSSGETLHANKSSKEKEDQSTSDNEGEEIFPEDRTSNPESKTLQTFSDYEVDPILDQDKVSSRSHTMRGKSGSGKQRSVTFLTENNDE